MQVWSRRGDRATAKTTIDELCIPRLTFCSTSAHLDDNAQARPTQLTPKRDILAFQLTGPSRGERFFCYPDRVECGDRVIRASDVKCAVLYEARQWFIPVYVLAVTTNKRAFQFGFNPWVKVASFLPFSFTRERISLRYSPFSVVVRVVLLAYLLLLGWRYCSGG